MTTWQCISNVFGGIKHYRPGRPIIPPADPSIPLHSGNIEYFGNWLTNKAEAEALVEGLNNMEINA